MEKVSGDTPKRVYTYDYPMPGFTADIAVIVRDENRDDNILLIKRRDEPFKGCWCLPGGYVNVGETSKQAATRELQEETGVVVDMSVNMHFIQIYDDPNRDPRGWTVSVLYLYYNPWKSFPLVVAGDDAEDYCWKKISELKPNMLGFDHFSMVHQAHLRFEELKAWDFIYE